MLVTLALKIRIRLRTDQRCTGFPSLLCVGAAFIATLISQALNACDHKSGAGGAGYPARIGLHDLSEQR